MESHDPTNADYQHDQMKAIVDKLIEQKKALKDKAVEAAKGKEAAAVIIMPKRPNCVQRFFESKIAWLDSVFFYQKNLFLRCLVGQVSSKRNSTKQGDICENECQTFFNLSRFPHHYTYK